MKLTLEEMKCEAVKRLEILNSIQPIEDLVINEFKEKGTVVYSEINYFNGLKIPTNFSLDTQSKVEDLKDIEPSFKTLVERFEKFNDALVYYTILSHTSIGRMLSILYVSKEKEEWEDDRKILKEHTPLAYICNFDEPDCSEFGYIKIAQDFGGVYRVA